MDSSQRDIVRLSEWALTALVTVIVAAATHNPFTPDWWGTTALTFVGTFLASYFLGHALLLPQIKESTPRQLNEQMTKEVVAASHNICAISSNWIDLWLTDSFIYYLHLNTAKSLAGFTQRFQSPLADLSDSAPPREAFYRRSCGLADSIGRREVQPRFFALRVLVYSAKDYKKHHELVKSIIQSHTLGRVHCIPIVLEKLMSRMSQEERRLFNEVLSRCDQPYSLKVPPRSRAQQFFQWALRRKRRHLLVPDLLLINDNPGAGTSTPVNPTPTMWWYGQGDEDLDSSSDQIDIARAHRVFEVLCRHASKCLWDQFTEQTVGLVPVAMDVASANERFFSFPYYEEWLGWIKSNASGKNVVSSARVLDSWLAQEETLLLRAITEGDRVLDVGCGTGRHADLMLGDGKCSFVAGVDINPNLLMSASRLISKYGRDRASFTVDDAALLLSCKSHEFDVIICMTNTLGNFLAGKQHDFLMRARDVLRPGGRLILSVYSDSAVSLQARRQSYELVGLQPFQEPGTEVIETVEGLWSEHFSTGRVKQLVEQQCGYQLLEPPRMFGEIGLWLVAASPGA